MTTFKEEMQALAHELIVTDPDFASVSIDVVHRQPQFQTYDEEFGDMIEYNSDAVYTAMIGPFAESKINAQDILLGDLRMVVAFVDVTQEINVSVDSIITPDGTNYTIIDKTLDTAEAAYIIQLRKRDES